MNNIYDCIINMQCIHVDKHNLTIVKLKSEWIIQIN